MISHFRHGGSWYNTATVGVRPAVLVMDQVTWLKHTTTGHQVMYIHGVGRSNTQDSGTTADTIQMTQSMMCIQQVSMMNAELREHKKVVSVVTAKHR